MIRGAVLPNRQAVVTVELLASDGQFQPFEFVLDTGFDGDLSLPSRTLRGLAAAPEGEYPTELADGSRIMSYAWTASALWDGQTRPILIVESDGEQLLGMNLLWQNLITLEAKAFGQVTIDRIE